MKGDIRGEHRLPARGTVTDRVVRALHLYGSRRPEDVAMLDHLLQRMDEREAAAYYQGVRKIRESETWR